MTRTTGRGASLTRERWIRLLGADPREWLMDSADPAAVWMTLSGLMGRPESDADVRAAREAVLRNAGTQDLINRLPDWESDLDVSGHNSPQYAPNLLLLLSQMGVRGGDDDRVERIVDQMLAHQDGDSRFHSFGRSGHGSIGRLPEPAWGGLLCDSHAVLEVLIRFGRAGDPRTRAGMARMVQDLTNTAQGTAWPCRPHSISGFRGPGRKADFCPQVTLEALRALARLPGEATPPATADAVRTVVAAWRRRGSEKPYMFGHGYRFKTVKWPAFWYDVHAVLDSVADYPEAWASATDGHETRQAIAEMAACLIAYNFGPDGRVIPRSCYKGFEAFSFGQKKRPSAFATAKLAGVLKRLEPLADSIAAVDVRSLTSSKGGSGTAVPPR